LADGLELLSKRFSESIGQLRESSEHHLNDLSAEHEQLFKSSAQAAASHANNEGAIAVNDCRSESTEAHSGTSARLNESWNLILETDDEAVSELISAYDTNSEQIGQRFDETKKRLEELVAEKLSKLELRSIQANQGIRDCVDKLIESADRHAFDSDVKLKERFSSLLYEMSTSFDDSASRSVADLVALHESSMADLVMKTEELSREMDSLAESVTGAAKAKSDDLREKGNSLVSTCTEELDSRREASKVFQKQIEDERSQLVSEIWKELTEVRARFEERLSKLAQSTLEKMRNICVEAENAMLSAQENCAAESKKHASEKQESIESATREFVKKIESTRDTALDAIAKAAGASSEELASAAAVEIGEQAAPEDDEEMTLDTTVEELKNEKGSEARRRKKSGKESTKRGEGKR
jgi:ElaB/YqjD/DUF883 family membrane-anchored ribosome-binding protein